MNIKPAKVVEKKLGRENAFGQYYDGVVEIDPRQSPKDYLDTLIHEHLHHLFGDLTEEEVVVAANQLASAIWAKNYRRIVK